MLVFATRKTNGDIILPNKEVLTRERERKKEIRTDIWELVGSVIIREELRRRVNIRREGEGEREKQLKKIGGWLIVW